MKTWWISVGLVGLIAASFYHYHRYHPEDSWRRGWKWMAELEAKKVEPVPPVVAIQSTPVPGDKFQSKFKAEMQKIEQRLHQLRVAEIRGALFEALAVDQLKGQHTDLEISIKAAVMAAESVGEKEDKETALAMREGAEQFAAKLREVQAEPKP